LDKELDPDSHGIYTKSFKVVKHGLHFVENVGSVLKENFNKGLTFFEEMYGVISKDRKLSVGYNQENNQSKLFALGYVLL